MFLLLYQGFSLLATAALPAGHGQGHLEGGALVLESVDGVDGGLGLVGRLEVDEGEVAAAVALLAGADALADVFTVW